MSDKNYINENFKRAVVAGNVEEFRKYLLMGADVNMNIRKHEKYTLLHECNCVKIVKELLLHGAVVDMRNTYKETPLHISVLSNHGLKKVKELLKHGADVNAVDCRGNTPLNLAVKRSSFNIDVIKELLKHGADINILNRERRSPLIHALRWDMEWAKLLIRFTLISIFDRGYTIVQFFKVQTRFKLSSYFDECVCEISKLKLYYELPLYRILTSHCNNSSCLLNYGLPNSTVIQLTNNTDYLNDFPICKDLLQDALEPIFKRRVLIQQLYRIQIYIRNEENEIKLDPHSIYFVGEYLPNRDLASLLIASLGSAKR